MAQTKLQAVRIDLDGCLLGDGKFRVSSSSCQIPAQVSGRSSHTGQGEIEENSTGTVSPCDAEIGRLQITMHKRSWIVCKCGAQWAWILRQSIQKGGHLRFDERGQQLPAFPDHSQEPGR